MTKRDRTDRQLTRLIKADSGAWIYEYDDTGRVGRLWHRIREIGRRAVRRRRTRRAVRWILINVLALLICGLLISCLCNGPMADAFREGIYGFEMHIRYDESAIRK